MTLTQSPDGLPQEATAQQCFPHVCVGIYYPGRPKVQPSTQVSPPASYAALLHFAAGKTSSSFITDKAVEIQRTISKLEVTVNGLARIEEWFVRTQKAMVNLLGEAAKSDNGSLPEDADVL